MFIYLYAFLVLTVLNAFKNISAKQSMKNVDPNTLAGVTGFVTVLVSIPFLMHEGIPDTLSPDFLWPLFFGGGLYYMGKYFNFTSLSLGDISLISPLNGLITISVMASSILLLGEYPSLVGGLGVLLVFLGTYVIALEKGNIRPLAPLKALWANPAARPFLVSIACYGFTVTIDRIGVGQSSFWFWTFCMNLFVGLFSLNGIIRDRSTLVASIVKSYKSFVLLVVLHVIVYVSQMYIVSQIIAPYTSAFKTASALFAVVLGGWFFRESHLLQRFLAALIIMS